MDAGGVRSERDLRRVGVALPLRAYLVSMWARRDFAWAVPMGRLRGQTQGTLLGGVWHLLNPVLTAGLYYLVFGLLFNGAGRIDGYAGFLVVGIFTYLFTSRAINAGARSVTANRAMVTQICFPRAILPVSTVIAETISHLWALTALLIVLPVIGYAPTVTWLLVLPAAAFQTLFNLGAAMMVARLAFHYRDIERLLPHVLRLWLYASGVFFTAAMVSEAVESETVGTVFEWNPTYIYMALMRDLLLGRSDSPTWGWVMAAAWAVASLAIGFRFFRAREMEYGRV